VSCTHKKNATPYPSHPAVTIFAVTTFRLSNLSCKLLKRFPIPSNLYLPSSLFLPPKSILARQFSHPVAAGEDEHTRNNRKKQVSISNRDDAGWLAGWLAATAASVEM